MKWRKCKLSDRCDVITGNTPSRAVKSNYGEYIEWIKTDNIVNDNYSISRAMEYLSEEGVKSGRLVDAGSLLMVCIAGSTSRIGDVAIIDRKVAFNQQINAIVPKEDNPVFLAKQLGLCKEYIHSSVNNMLKGILSKGKLEKLQFVFPPVEQQREFATFVQRADNSKVAIQKSISLIKFIYCSL